MIKNGVIFRKLIDNKDAKKANTTKY